MTYTGYLDEKAFKLLREIERLERIHDADIARESLAYIDDLARVIRLECSKLQRLER